MGLTQVGKDCRKFFAQSPTQRRVSCEIGASSHWASNPPRMERFRNFSAPMFSCPHCDLLLSFEKCISRVWFCLFSSDQPIQTLHQSSDKGRQIPQTLREFGVSRNNWWAPKGPTVNRESGILVSGIKVSEIMLKWVLLELSGSFS